jgi:hypothetical protein
MRQAAAALCTPSFALLSRIHTCAACLVSHLGLCHTRQAYLKPATVDADGWYVTKEEEGCRWLGRFAG